MFAVRDETATRDEIRKHGAVVTNAVRRARLRREPGRRVALAELGVDEGEDPWNVVSTRPELRAEQIVQAPLNLVIQDVFQSLGLDALNILLQRVADGLSTDLHALACLDVHDLDFGHLLRRLSNDAFGLNSISTVSMAYFELELFNRLCRLDLQQGREPEFPPLDEPEFRRRYGPPPCEVINGILERLGKRHDLLDKSVRLLRDHPDWIPVEIEEVFKALLREEP